VLSRLRLSVDWFDIRVNNAIGAQTVASALQQCFDPALNPLVATDAAAAAATQFCQNVPRTGTGATGNILTTYVNNGRFHIQGIDTQLDWAMDVGPGTLTANLVANYLIDFESAALPTQPLVDYVGSFGPAGENGLNGGGAYEYRLFANLGYSWGKANLGLQWQHWPGYEDTAEIVSGTPTSTTGAPAYDLFNLNAGYQLMEDVNLRFGVDNLFNKAPPLTGTNPDANLSFGQLRGGSFASGVYDTIGRRFYLGANIRF
jgi:outer membrane receptor protein involved in Fe transport